MNLAILETIFVYRKVLEVPYVKTLLQNATDDRSFQNFTLNNVERAKITFCNHAIIRINKCIGCLKSRFEDDSQIKRLYKQRSSFGVPGL